MTSPSLTVVTTELDNALARRQHAKAEIERLKAIVSSCDVEIMAALDSPEGEFVKWVREVRGEVQDHEVRKVRWSDGQDKYIVYKRNGKRPGKTIVAEKLLDAGVPAHVIQSATVYGKPGVPGISVRKLLSDADENVGNDED